MNLSTGAAELGQGVANALMPRTPSNASASRQALAMLQMPVLAFGTALAAGGIIIALTDLQLLGELYDAIGRLQLAGYLLLALSLAAAAAALQ